MAGEFEEIGPTDLIGEVKRRQKGFSQFITSGKAGCTGPWSRLEMVAIETIESDKRPFVGEITMLIRQSGIKDDKLSQYYKTIFREDVYPAIKNRYPECGDIFRLTLRFNNDLLSRVKLEYIK